MKTGVIIVTYNATRWHEKCLEPLAKETANGKVYIIDNGSTDGTQELIKSKYKNFVFYQSESNLGFGKANNLGFKLALEDECTNFLLLNQDASITWDEIKYLSEQQSINNEYGILSPLHKYNETTVDKLHLKSIHKNGLEYFNDLLCGKLTKEIYEIDYTNAAIWLISKECIENVGGFDPLFPHYGEDSEYAQRIKHFGYKIGLCPTVKGYHFRQQENDRKMNKSLYYVSYLVDLKNYDRNLWKSYFIISVRILASMILDLRTMNFQKINSKCSAFTLALKNYSKIKKNRKINLVNSYCFLNTHNIKSTNFT